MNNTISIKYSPTLPTLSRCCEICNKPTEDIHSYLCLECRKRLYFMLYEEKDNDYYNN